MLRRMWFSRPKRNARQELDELRDDIEAIRRKFEESTPGKRIEAIERDLADLRDLHEELHRSHTRQRARQGMRDMRARANGELVTLEELERKHGLRR